MDRENISTNGPAANSGGPEAGRGPRSFTRVFRGYDPGEVDEYVEQLKARLRQATTAPLTDRELSGEEMSGMVDSMVGDIAEVLQAAILSADKLRNRAEQQINADLSAVEAEAQRRKAVSESDAFDLRKSVWDMAVETLDQLEVQMAEMEAEADRKALQIIGESERTAHRNLATTRREADRVVQEASAKAEQILARAREKREEITQDRERRVEAIQKQVRIETRRRDSLREEVKELQSRLEGPPAEEDYETVSTVRLVPPSEGNGSSRTTSNPGSNFAGSVPQPPQEAPVDGQDLAEEIALLRETGEIPITTAPVAGPGPGNPTNQGTAPPRVSTPNPGESANGTGSTTGEAEPYPEQASPADTGLSDWDLAKMWTTGKPTESIIYEEEVGANLGSLFEDLRRLQQMPAKLAAEAEVAGRPNSLGSGEEGDGSDSELTARSSEETRVASLERYQRLLLPIVNRTLRNMKRQLIDVHNEQLDALNRDPSDWQPSKERLDKALVHDVTIMHSEAYIAGHNAARQMADKDLPLPRNDMPVADPEAFISALFDELVLTVQVGRENGKGARGLGSALSQVYRRWRTDEAERRVRFLAARSYHQGLLFGLWQAGVEYYQRIAGEGCRSCLAQQEPALVSDSVPGLAGFPCSCTIVAA